MKKSKKNSGWGCFTIILCMLALFSCNSGSQNTQNEDPTTLAASSTKHYQSVSESSYNINLNNTEGISETTEPSKTNKYASDKNTTTEETTSTIIKIEAPPETLSAPEVKNTQTYNTITESASADMVWISQTGLNYHCKKDCGNINSDTVQEISLENAKSQGLDACSNCFSIPDSEAVPSEETTPEPLPEPEPLSEPETESTEEYIPPAENGFSDMVWISATGSKYHSINNCGNMNPNKAKQIPLQEAIDRGMDACSKCH